jgi:hypothetical protein
VVKVLFLLRYRCSRVIGGYSCEPVGPRERCATKSDTKPCFSLSVGLSCLLYMYIEYVFFLRIHNVRYAMNRQSHWW